MKKYIFISLLVFLTSYSYLTYGQLSIRGNTPLLEKQDIVEYFDTMVEEYTEEGGLLPLSTSDFFNFIESEKKHLLKLAPITRETFNDSLAKITAKSGDTHSEISPYYYAKYNEKLKLNFKIETTIENNKRVFIAVNHLNSHYYHKDYPYLTHINHTSIEDLISKIKTYIPQHATTSLYYIRGLKLLTYFQYFFNYSEKEIFLTLKNNQGKKKIISSKLIKEGYRSLYLPIEGTRFLKERKIGIFRLIDFNKRNSKQKNNWIGFMEKSKQTRGIIIDMRGNTGGFRDFFRFFFPYFLKDNQKHFITAKGVCLKSSKDCIRKSKNRFFYFIENFNQSTQDFFRKENIPTTLKNSAINPKKYTNPMYHIIQNERKYAYFYNKPVVILTNEHNFSSTDVFLQAVKNLDHLHTIGAPTSGGSGGSKFTSKLGYTISNMISLTLDEPARTIEGNSYIPKDIQYPDKSFFIQKKDIVLEKAIEYIENN